MKIKTIALLLGSHIVIGAVGFAAGIYTLPILTAPEAPSSEQIASVTNKVLYQTEFKRDLKDSDALHWGEGKVSITSSLVGFQGKLAPGPNYKLYFSPTFVETEQEFERLKSTMIAAGNVDTFNNFIVELPEDIKLEDYNSVVVWCESFGEFITAAQYR